MNGYSPYIFFSASKMLVLGGAVSGCGVITSEMIQVEGSEPVAITLDTISLLVKIPTIVPFSITKTAVLLKFFIILAASLTVVLASTLAGNEPTKTLVKSGNSIFSLRTDMYCIIG